jgi:hypothetical protein
VDCKSSMELHILQDCFKTAIAAMSTLAVITLALNRCILLVLSHGNGRPLTEGEGVIVVLKCSFVVGRGCET